MNWKTRLKQLLASETVIENPGPSPRTPLPETDETTLDPVSSAFVSANVPYVRKNPVESAGDSVFDATNEIGSQVIRRLVAVNDEHAAQLKPFIYLNTPTVAGYEAELELVRTIKGRSSGATTEGALEQALDHYIKTHQSESSMPDSWTSDDVPLFYLTLTRNGQRLESYTCNGIQCQIIEAFWRQGSPDAGIDITPLD